MPGHIAAYTHDNGAIGVLVELAFRQSRSAQTPELKELASDLAMHIAAMQPRVVNPTELDTTDWSEELERISRSPEITSMSPVDRFEALRTARNRYEGHFCLLKQPFVKGPALVEDRIADVAAQLGEQIEVVRFVRFATQST